MAQAEAFKDGSARFQISNLSLPAAFQHYINLFLFLSVLTVFDRVFFESFQTPKVPFSIAI